METNVMNLLEPTIESGIIRTLSGKQFNLFEPAPEMIDIEDIATALANKGHFSGLTPSFFPIARHSVMVCDEISFREPSVEPEMKLLALLHDAAESYIGDMIKPLKVRIAQFSKVEEEIMKAICCRYKLDYASLHLVKSADIFIREVEYNAFYHEGRLTYMNPEQAKNTFMDRFNQYYHD